MTRFTLATAVARLQILAFARPKSARFTMATNFVRLQVLIITIKLLIV